MNKILFNPKVCITRLTAEQAHSADKKPRIAVQGILSIEQASGKGKRATPKTVHEFSALRSDNGMQPGAYLLLGATDDASGIIVFESVEEKPYKVHEVNGVVYAKHAAKIKHVAGKLLAVGAESPF